MNNLLCYIPTYCIRMLVYLKKHRKMILFSIFFFYLGCGITINLLRIECADAALEKSNTWDNIEYAVLILSGPDNEIKRDAVRATWAKFASNLFIENGERLYKWNHTWNNKNTVQNKFVGFYFVIGTQGLDKSKMDMLQGENERTNDLLLLNSFTDSYKDLSVKVLNALKWISNNIRNLKYLIKCDDDSFVRIDLLIKDLEAFAPDMSAPEIRPYISLSMTRLPIYKGLYWGYFDGRAKVYLTGKWQEEDWFLCDNYLPYALGGGYVISRSIVDYIARNSDMLSYYNSEDVSMGVWTAPLGINRVHDIRFDTQWKSRGCNTNMLVRHKQTPSNMFQMYRSLVYSQGEKLCKTENIERNSYLYKWNVLPSMCCR